MSERTAATAVIEKNEDEQQREVDGSASSGARGIRLPFRAKSPVATVISTLVVAAVVATIAVLGWQLDSVSGQLDARDRQSAQHERAEQVALDYASGAAEMNFDKPQEWRGRLTKGTTPELANRLGQAATSMEQLIRPLQWTSTAHPIAAKVESESNGVYQVVCFVNVLTKNAQAPDGIESTATYKLSIDGNRDWLITEISGIDSALGGGGPQQPK